MGVPLVTIGHDALREVVRTICRLRAGRRLPHPSWRPRRNREQAALEALTFLSEASVQLGSSLDPERIVNMIVGLARGRLGDGVLLWLRDGENIELAMVNHADPETASFIRAAIGAHPPRMCDDLPPGAVLRTGRPVVVQDLHDLDPRRFLSYQSIARFNQLRLGPSMTMPMRSRDRVIGAITVGRRVGEPPYSPVEETIAADLARQGAVALDNARLFRDTQEAGRALQRSMLPAHPPALDGAEVAMEYRPGTQGTEVGGDFYDVIPLSGGRVGLAIGDVMGRGLQAAAVMGQLRAALRAYALEDWGPADLLARLDVMVDSLPGLPFATCLYGVYEPRTGRAVLAGAGHPAPLLVQPGTAPEFVTLEPGLPLGVGENTVFTETTVQLPPGSGLVLFTDGLVESRHRSLDEGLERLRRGVGEQLERRRAVPSRPAEVEFAAARLRHPSGSALRPTDVVDRAAGAAGAAGAGLPPRDAAGAGPERRGAGTGAGTWTGPERRSGVDRRASRDRRVGASPDRPLGVERRRGEDRRRRNRGGFSARSWSGPDTVDPDYDRWPEGAARALIELSLIAADLPTDTDDDTALLVLSTLPAGPPLLELALPAVAASAGQARMAVRAVLHEHGIGRGDDAALLVSEVVTNAITHARSELVLRAWMQPGRLRISVEDREGATLPQPGSAARGDTEAESGWGLLLVEALSDAWGVQTTRGGKRVWFDLDLLTSREDPPTKAADAPTATAGQEQDAAASGPATAGPDLATTSQGAADDRDKDPPNQDGRRPQDGPDGQFTHGRGIHLPESRDGPEPHPPDSPTR
jgi:anti-sigma regulatory factor (Ser/Thr protein kinase)